MKPSGKKKLHVELGQKLYEKAAPKGALTWANLNKQAKNLWALRERVNARSKRSVVAEKPATKTPKPPKKTAKK